ncbi:hypothetical protein PG987_006773 [Apiospora arundinis]|uniref:Uncharacterized protein n=1 Tax=Apiospora arundinis TaxID=335852 RepID=A0ABR2IA59_9PEZI
MKATQISSFAFATVAALAGTSLARGIAKRGVLAINHAEGANVINVAGEFSFGELSCYKVDDPTRRKKSPIRVVCEIPDGEKEILFATPRDVKIDLKKQGLECQVQNPGGRPGSDLEQLCQVPDGLKLIEFYIPWDADVEVVPGGPQPVNPIEAGRGSVYPGGGQ